MVFLFIALILYAKFWRCPLRAIGLSCPGCGMTSAFYAVFDLNFRLAFYFHPLWPLVILVAVYFVIKYLGWLRISENTERKLVMLVAVLFIGVYFYRLLVSHSPVVQYTLFDIPWDLPE